MAAPKKIPLNPEQLAVVEHDRGPLLVDAVAGSGKSTALIERVVYLINERHVSPTQILLLTFSKDAQTQVEQRLQKRMPFVSSGIARTFHSLALDIYKQETAKPTYIDANGALYRKALYQAYRRLRIEPAPKPLVALASRAKNDLLDISSATRRAGKVDAALLEAAREIAAASDLDADDLVQALYLTEDIREREGVDNSGVRTTFVTFDDMLYDAVALLRKPAVHPKWCRRWAYIMNDEGQDQCAAQITIAELLAKEHRNILMVGDCAQVIYGWRGASTETMRSFPKHWPGTKLITMFRNYRSGHELIEVANKVRGNMPPNTLVADPTTGLHPMTSERNSRSAMEFHVFADDDEEARAIAQNCTAHHRAGIPFSNQTILIRMNFMSRAIEMALAGGGVPYRLISGASFFDAKETQIMLGYVRVAMNRASSDDVTNALLFPSRGLSKAICDSIASAGSINGDWLKAVKKFAETAAPQPKDKLRQWCGMIEIVQRYIARDESPHQILSFIREATSIDQWMKRNVEQDDDAASVQTLEEVMSFSQRYITTVAMLDAIDAIERHRNTYKRQTNCVTVVTIHKYKGQEAPVIYLPQMAHGRFPSRRGDINEERRLFYVAVTRAMDELWISRPATSHRNIERAPRDDAEEMMTNSAGLMEDDSHVDSIFISELNLRPATSFTAGKLVDPAPIGTQMSLL